MEPTYKHYISLGQHSEQFPFLIETILKHSGFKMQPSNIEALRGDLYLILNIDTRDCKLLNYDMYVSHREKSSKILVRLYEFATRESMYNMKENTKLVILGWLLSSDSSEQIEERAYSCRNSLSVEGFNNLVDRSLNRDEDPYRVCGFKKGDVVSTYACEREESRLKERFEQVKNKEDAFFTEKRTVKKKYFGGLFVVREASPIYYGFKKSFINREQGLLIKNISSLLKRTSETRDKCKELLSSLNYAKQKYVINGLIGEWELQYNALRSNLDATNIRYEFLWVCYLKIQVLLFDREINKTLIEQIQNLTKSILEVTKQNVEQSAEMMAIGDRFAVDDASISDVKALVDTLEVLKDRTFLLMKNSELALLNTGDTGKIVEEIKMLEMAA